MSGFLASAQSEKKQSSLQPETIVIGNIQLAKQAAYDAAQAEGLACYIYDEFIEGEASLVADNLYLKLQNASSGIHIFGGETTVHLPDTPGIGGRNQTLALAFARHLTENSTLHLLAAGTDGVDGNSNCAGAAVSKNTVLTARKMGFDVDTEISKANAGLVLMATGDLVDGSSSNTNVMDIIIAYKTEQSILKALADN